MDSYRKSGQKQALIYLLCCITCTFVSRGDFIRYLNRSVSYWSSCVPLHSLYGEPWLWRQLESISTFYYGQRCRLVLDEWETNDWVQCRKVIPFLSIHHVHTVFIANASRSVVFVVSRLLIELNRFHLPQLSFIAGESMRL